MGELEGVSITNREGRWILERLREVGRADDVTAAASIEHGLDNDIPIDWLTNAERLAVMMALIEAPESFVELRKALASNLRYPQ